MKVPLPQKESRVLANWVTSSLREAILRGFFEPGEKLDQDMIAQELKVSRTPIREALKVLEAEGFVEIRSYRGAYVTEISRQDIQDVYEIRRLLESEVISQSCLLIPDEVYVELEKSIREDMDELNSGEHMKHFTRDSYFHDTIMSYCKNRLFKEILDNLTNRIARVRYFALRQPDTFLAQSLKEHMGILEAMQKRDPSLASQQMNLHLENSGKRIQKLLDERA